VRVEVERVEEDVEELGPDAAISKEEGDRVVGAEDEISLLERVFRLMVAGHTIDVEPVAEDVDGDQHDEGELPVGVKV
jgi:hypothetical protein